MSKQWHGDAGMAAGDAVVGSLLHEPGAEYTSQCHILVPYSSTAKKITRLQLLPN